LLEDIGGGVRGRGEVEDQMIGVTSFNSDDLTEVVKEKRLADLGNGESFKPSGGLPQLHNQATGISNRWKNGSRFTTDDSFATKQCRNPKRVL